MTAAPDPVATVVVLAGGESRRFGSDKLAADFGAGSVLDRTLSGMPRGWPVVCVGPARPTMRAVVWTREDPPGGGPLAGIGAALPRVTTAVMVVVAGDMPAAGGVVEALVDRLVAPRGRRPVLAAVAAEDESGHVNPLLAAYRSIPLRAVLPADPRGRPATLLLRALDYVTLSVDGPAGLDVDTRRDLDALRRRLES